MASLLPKNMFSVGGDYSNLLDYSEGSGIKKLERPKDKPEGILKGVMAKKENIRKKMKMPDVVFKPATMVATPTPGVKKEEVEKKIK